MIMKKIALFTALLALGFAANAQTLNVQSAMSDLKRGYLNKAKASIDKACAHEDTKDDAKTWYYAGLIYSQIGGETMKAKSKYKDLDPDWCDKAYAAALRCKELDTKGEYTDGNKGVFTFLGNIFYERSINLFNEGKYKEALKEAEESIKISNNTGDKELANGANYIAGYSCQLLNDNDGVKKYFGPLVRSKKVKNPEILPMVYNTMIAIYKGENDTANVIKTAKHYTQVMNDDPNAQLMLASAYIWTNNKAKGIELADKAIASMSDTSSKYPLLLCGAAGIYDEAGEYDKAEKTYKRSAEIQPNQIDANYGMGSMLFNRAADKNAAIGKMIESGQTSDEDEVVMNKLNEEMNQLFEQAIPYLKNAITYIDNLSEQEKATVRSKLYNCLKTLSICYARLDMLNEAKPIQERITQIEQGK